MHRHQTGFSLVELTLTATLAAIVLSIGIPSFQSLSHQNHAEAHQEEFLSAVRLARQVALEHSRTVEICPRDPGIATTASAQCDTSAAGAWENGWVIRLEGTALMTNRHDVDDSTFTITTPGGDTKSIQFSPTGTLSGTTCVHIKVDTGGEVGQLRINLAGHIQLDKESC